MPRLPGTVVPWHPHLVTQRGNRGLPAFFSDADDEADVALMAKQCGARGLVVWAWCLLPDHVHPVAAAETAEALAGGIGEAHQRYTRRSQGRRRQSGPGRPRRRGRLAALLL